MSICYQSQVNGILEIIWIQQEADNRDYIMSFSLYKLIPNQNNDYCMKKLIIFSNES